PVLCTPLPPPPRSPLFPYTTLFRSRASGAGAYVQSFGTGARSCFRSSSVKREVVRALVGARALLAQLHQDVVEERRRAETIEVGDRKSTRLNSSHVKISYAVFCLKK